MLSDRCLSACLLVTLVYCGQTAGWIKAPLGTEVGPAQAILCQIQLPSTEKGTSAPPLFGQCLFCGQTTVGLRCDLVRGVGLGPGHIVLDGDPSPTRKGAQQPLIFGSCLLWSNGRPSQRLLSSCLTNSAESVLQWVDCDWFSTRKDTSTPIWRRTGPVCASRFTRTTRVIRCRK